MWKFTIFLVVLALGISYYFKDSEPTVPTLAETYWGKKDSGKDDSNIRPFKINVSYQVIEDLNERLDKTRTLVEPLEGVGWTYGISTKYLQTVLNYWRKQYDWSKRQDLLNKYPQFVTDIQGLTIHFYHVKPTISKDRKLKVLPILLVHGWPGSVVEFQKIIPMLTTPHPNFDFVFEVIVPSLPGYGFSDSAIRPGLGCADVAVIFKNLMSRLGIEKFYTQGGDWGSAITSHLARLYPERILGIHLNMCVSSKMSTYFWTMIGSYFPSLVVSEEHQSKMYPISHHWIRLLQESGYMHIQTTKPDTIGTALSDSPTGLAAYILEKFSTWTNDKYKFRDDGGLLEKFTIDELLDNLMIYWVTNSITTSQRLYSDSFNVKVFNLDKISVKVPTGCASFPHEVIYFPETLVSSVYKNIIQFSHMPRGGHFAAFEEPELLSNDLRTFVAKREAMLKEEKAAEKLRLQEENKKKNPKKS